MKKVKLKNWNAHIKQKIIATFIISVFLTLVMIISLTKNISSNLTDYIIKVVKRENTLILKDSFSQTEKNGVDIDRLIKVVKNSKEEITEVDFDMVSSAKLLTGITSYINEHITEYNYLGYRVDVPVGFLTNSPIFVNLGPKIPIKVELSDIALGNVKTVVKPFGINSALIEVYLDIYLKTSILYPFQTLEENTEYSSLVASKIISGTVPSFFGGSINSKSDTINLPLNE